MTNKPNVYQKMINARKKAYAQLTDDQKAAICDAMTAWLMLRGTYEALQHPDFEDIVSMSRTMSRLDHALCGGHHHE